ncbi:MAG: hypothetical protein ACT4TC_16695, partial [Myxococcaceae bacterium]
YGLEPHARLLYNIARAYDQAVETESALQYYQLYLSANEGTDPTLLKRAALNIDRLRLSQAKNQSEAREQESERKRLTAEAKAAAKRAEDEAAAKRKSDERKRELEQDLEGIAVQRKKTLAFVSAGVGAAALATSVVMGLNFLSSNSAFREEGKTLQQKQDLRRAAQTQALVADLGIIVAAAGALTAVLLYPKDEKPRVVVVPAGNGLGVVGQF